MEKRLFPTERITKHLGKNSAINMQEPHNARNYKTFIRAPRKCPAYMEKHHAARHTPDIF